MANRKRAPQKVRLAPRRVKPKNPILMGEGQPLNAPAMENPAAQGQDGFAAAGTLGAFAPQARDANAIAKEGSLANRLKELEREAEHNRASTMNNSLYYQERLERLSASIYQDYRRLQARLEALELAVHGKIQEG